MSDHTETQAVEERLRKATNALHKMADDVATARQVIEFSSDRRKNLLAKYTAPLLISNGVAASETLARADENYQREFGELETQHREAERAKKKWEATQATFEASRSLLSHEREKLRQI